MKDGQEYLLEIKARAKGFTNVYRLFNQYAASGVLCVALEKDGKTALLRICDNPVSALQSPGQYQKPPALDRRLTGKLLTMQKWIQDCDVLVIKDDRQPPLYLRYLKDESEVSNGQ